MYPTFRSAWQRAADPCTRSPAPSKIPYGGFSPVRLQTSIRAPPSSAQRRLIDTFLPRRASTRFSCPVSWTCVPSERAGRRPQNHSSSGPWLRSRFYCPAASTLTMATSETLALRHGLCIRPQRYSSARGSPIYSCLSFGMCRLPYPGGSDDFIRLFIHRRCCFHPMRRDSTTALARPIRSSLIAHETAKFTLCYGPHHCSPHPVGTFTSELSLLNVAIQQRRISLRGQQSISHDWSFTSWTSSLMGCDRTPQYLG